MKKFKIVTVLEKCAHIFTLICSAILVLLSGAVLFYGLFVQKADVKASLMMAALCLSFCGITWLIWNVRKFGIALKVIVVVIAISVSLLGTLMGAYAGYGFYQDVALPEICKNFVYHQSMQEQTQYIQDEFSDRINKMYSAPITENDLKKSLVNQGFRLPDHPNPDQLPKVWAYAEYNSIPCDQYWSVEWTTQGDGIAYDIHGIYNSSCL